MILNAENIVLFIFHSLNGIIQKIDMGRSKSRIRKRGYIHRVRMILRRYLYFTAFHISDRVVSSSVAEFQFIRFGSVRQSYHLMSEANTENRISASNISHQRDNLRNVLRISRTVRKENTVRIQFLYLFCRSIERNHGYIAAARFQRTKNIVFYSAINRDNMVFRFRGFYSPRLFAADLLDSVRRRNKLSQLS